MRLVSMRLSTLGAITLLRSIESLARAQANDYRGSYFTIGGGAPLVSERVDPIISPGKSPSNHVHDIFGTDRFQADWDYDTVQSSGCNNMGPRADHSSYW